jgi:hypothetical protein
MIFINMKVIVEENQFGRVIQLIAEGKIGRSLLMARKSGIGAIFPKSAIANNPLRFRPYEREKLGIEETDLDYEPPVDNSDDQL